MAMLDQEWREFRPAYQAQDQGCCSAGIDAPGQEDSVDGGHPVRRHDSRQDVSKSVYNRQAEKPLHDRKGLLACHLVVGAGFEPATSG